MSYPKAEPISMLFLDIDGVLNSLEFQNSDRFLPTGRGFGDHDEIDPVAAQLLLSVITQTGAYIIISSSWRKFRTLQQIRDSIGYHIPYLSRHIVGMTPFIEDVPRSDEITEYIRRWPMIGPITGLAIVDDDPSAGCDLPHRFVRTEWEAGLRLEHVEPLVGLLTDPFDACTELP